MTLPTVDFCGLQTTRLLIGANPFAGFSHQTAERDSEMRAYYTPERIRETWARAEASGINTFVTNNQTPHVVETTRKYLAEGGTMHWFGQLNHEPFDGNMFRAIDRAIEIGAKAAYLHGGIVDELCEAGQGQELREWIAHGKSQRLPIGVAGHKPRTHYWVAEMDIVDFHAVCFFTCGSVHEGSGDKFRLKDVPAAVECIQRIGKPCIAYKIMAAGRVAPRMALDYAFEHIKPCDVVNVGMYRGDSDDMVEENARIVAHLLKHMAAGKTET